MRTIAFQLNDKAVRVEVDPDRRLLWVLRSELALTGTKFGCDEGYCGACTVLVDGKAVRSCLWPMKAVDGKKVLTIEGLAKGDKLSALQQAFIEHGALQCGYCTPGMILSAYSLLKKTPRPTPEQIITGLEDNLCRCGAHSRIIRAVQSAAAKMEGGQP